MNADGTLALGFELAAVKRLADPQGAYVDAVQWSQYFGVVSDKPAHAVNKFTRDHRIQIDFEPGPDGKAVTLAEMRHHFQTDRYVFVGTNRTDRELADEHGWEYLPVEEAAEAGGWELTPVKCDTDSSSVDDPSSGGWP